MKLPFKPAVLKTIPVPVVKPPTASSTFVVVAGVPLVIKSGVNLSFAFALTYCTTPSFSSSKAKAKKAPSISLEPDPKYSARSEIDSPL